MIARGFKSVIWVATVGSAALACYMVSLRVATERGELAKVERQIIEARREIRSLQTELGTRARMTQLEQWNAEVLALAAPSSAQFLKDEFTLARLYRNDPTVAERTAQVRLASAEAPAGKPAPRAKPVVPAVVQAVAERPAAPTPMVHTASFTTEETTARPKPKPAVAKPDKPADRRTASAAPTKPEPAAAPSGTKPSRSAAERTASAASVKPETAPARSTSRPGTKPATAAAKPVREAVAETREAKGKGGGGH